MQSDDARRFGGLARLYGQAGYGRLRRAHVLVVGIGGVGSWAAEALARCGVARLTLVDLDHVAESNIQRQIQADNLSIGAAKVAAMQARIALIHPTCQVDAIDAFVDTETWPTLAPLLAAADAVIDACDDWHAKTLLAAWALLHSAEHQGAANTHQDAVARIFISCGAAGGKRQVTGAKGLQVADLAHVSHDPVLAKLRYNLRKYHGAKTPAATKNKSQSARSASPAPKIGIPCVYSPEPVQAPCDQDPTCSSDGSLNCAGYGSTVTVTASFGLAAANFVIQQLTRT